MSNIEFKDNGIICITTKIGRPLFSGEAKDLSDKELYMLIQFSTLIKEFLLNENKRRKHKVK
jgi:hypothetical protein